MTYTTASLVEAELQSTTSFSTATVPTLSEVTTWIGEVDDYIDLVSGQSFETASYTDVIDYDGDDRIQLKHAPVQSVTTFQYSTVALSSTDYPAWETQTENTDYALYGDRGEVKIIWGNFKPKVGDKRIQITYVAGPTSVPGRVQMLATKLVAKRVIDSVLSKDIKERQSGKSISVGSISIVKPSDFGVNQYKTLGMDIEKLKNEILRGSGAYRYTNY